MAFVLAGSFTIDAFVLSQTIRELLNSVPEKEKNNKLKYLWKNKIKRDPFITSVLSEDIAATTGILIACVGTYYTITEHNIIYDTLACITVGSLLGFVSLNLIAINKIFLVGKAVDEEIVMEIKQIIQNRPAIAGN